MARRKTKSRSRSKDGNWLTAIRDHLPHLPSGNVKRWMNAIAWAVGLSALTVGWIIGVPKLEAVAATSVPAERIEIEFADLPTWVEGDLLAMLEVTARRVIGGDPLDRNDLIDAHDALMNTGWFVEVTQVRRVRSDLVRIEADYVRPFALVRDREGDHLVDPAGRLLPRTFPANDTAARPWLMRIDGAHFNRPARPGLAWDGADITAALHLLRLIDGRTWRHQVAAINVSRFLDNGRLVIITDRNSKIIWGSAPGEAEPGEAPAERKLHYLDEQYKVFGHIDVGEKTIDITSFSGVLAE